MILSCAAALLSSVVFSVAPERAVAVDPEKVERSRFPVELAKATVGVAAPLSMISKITSGSSQTYTPRLAPLAP